MKARLRHRFGRSKGTDHSLFLFLDRIPAGAGQKHGNQRDDNSCCRLLYMLHSRASAPFLLPGLFFSSFRRNLSVVFPESVSKIKLKHSPLP